MAWLGLTQPHSVCLFQLVHFGVASLGLVLQLAVSSVQPELVRPAALVHFISWLGCHGPAWPGLIRLGSDSKSRLDHRKRGSESR